MNTRKLFLSLSLATGAMLYAKELTPLNFITPEVVKYSDLSGLNEDIESVLLRFDLVCIEAKKFAASVQKENREICDAVTKRLEIVARLKNYINARKNGSSEMRIMAWQGAKEMNNLLDYFKAEENNYATQKMIKERVTLSVKDFGAMGDGVTDDAPAFRKAISKAAELKGKAVTLNIPSGTYFIASPTDQWKPAELKIRTEAKPYSNGKTMVYPKLSRGHILIANMDNFTLRGEKNTKILFGNSTMLGFRIVGCRNLKLDGFSIDFKEYTFTQGKVVKVEKEPFALIFKPQKGYPAPNEERFMKASARRFTPHLPNGLYGIGTVRMGNIEALTDGTFRLFPQKHDKKHHVWLERKTGDVITIIARFDSSEAGEASAMDLRECGFCEIRNITIHKAPGVGFRVFNNYALRLINCRIEPAPGTDDMMTTNADGCQTTGIIGPYIAKCYFSGMEDDGFNIHSSSPEVADVAGNNSTRPFASKGGFLINGLTGQLKALLRPMPKGRPAYTKPLPPEIFSRKMVKQNLTAHQREAQNYYGGRSHLFTERPDRITLIPGDLSGTVITDTEFFNIRGMALQLTAPNILVENCRIKHMNSYGINISALLPWGMTFNPHNVVIRNTKIDGTANPSISIRYRGVKKNGFCDPRFINDILVENCEIIQKPWCAVEVRNGSDIIFKNCCFVQTGVVKNKDYSGIYFDNFADFILENNTFVIKTKENYAPLKFKNPEEKKYLNEKGTAVK